jgi:membrane-associated phospholipid phosphatase
MLFLTDFADEAVVLPLLAAVLCGLLAGGWWRGALGWAAVSIATLTAVASAKLTVFIAGPTVLLPALTSPSGHTAAAPLAYTGLLLVALPPGRVRLLAAPAALLAAAGIGATRLAIGVHSLPDVIAGAALGLLGTAGLGAALGPRPAEFRPWATLLLALAAIAGFHGLRLPAEPWLHALAGR